MELVVNKLNPYLVPEMAVHAALTFLMLINFQWIALILNLPILLWNVNKVVNKDYTLDATEIFRTLSRHQKESFVKLAAYLLLFF